MYRTLHGVGSLAGIGRLELYYALARPFWFVSVVDIQRESCTLCLS